MEPLDQRDPDPATWPLRGFRVVDLSVGIPGAYCARLLADGGADVVKVESPEGDPLRRWSASGSEIPAGCDGPLFTFLHATHESITAAPDEVTDGAEPFRRLLSDADAAVWSSDSPFAGCRPLQPRSLRTAFPHLVVAAISPFGLGSPWSDRPATEFTLQALAGGMGVRGPSDRPPLSVGGRTGDWAAGMYAALGILIARLRSRDTGAGEIVDISVLESLVATHSRYPITHRSIAGTPMRERRSVNFPGIEKTRDGWVGFMTVTGQQWLDFCAMVGRQDWVEDESLILLENRLQHRDRMGPAIEQWMAERTTAEIIDLATAFRIPVSEIGTGATLTQMEHFVARHAFVWNADRTFRQPGVPFHFRAGPAARPLGPAPRLGEHAAATATSADPPAPVLATATPARRPRTAELPLDGVRVLDFTAFWAGPVIGHALAIFGADVIHVESTKRLDGFRAQSTRPGQDLWWEFVPGFIGANTNKRGLTLDMSSDRGRAITRRLIAECDVLIDNFTPRVLDEWGLTYDELKKLRPDIILVRAPAFGVEGPWRDRVGYAQTLEQVSGLAWRTGWPDREPALPNGLLDPISGGHATIALLLALDHRRSTGDGGYVEAPMVGSALNIAAEQLVEYETFGQLLTRQGNRGPGAVPQGAYRTADPAERYVAVSVETERHWEGLRSLLAAEQWPADPDLQSSDGRRRHEDALDGCVAAWCAARTADESLHALHSAGVPAEEVVMAHRIDELAPLIARGYFETVEHPVVGTITQEGFPVRLEHGPHRVHRRPSPTLGQDNRSILGGLLGLSDAEIRTLEQERVIGDRPVA